MALPFTAVGDQCLPGWEMYQKKCYYFDKTAYKIWEDSRTECLSYGADLVIIKDTDVEVRQITFIILSRIKHFLIHLTSFQYC